MVPLARRVAVVTALAATASAPAWAGTVEVDVSDEDWISACAEWGEGDGWADDEDPAALGEEFSYETLCAVSHERAVAGVTTGAEHTGHYARYDCVWVEEGWADPETGEEHSFLVASCEVVDERSSATAPGTVARDGDVYIVEGQIAGCEADFRVTSVAPPPWPDDEPSWRPPVYAYSTAEGRFVFSGEIDGSACGVTLSPPTAFGRADDGHERRGVGITTP